MHREEETLLVFAVLAIVVLSTFTGVAMRGTWFANAGGNMLTGVELTSVHTLLTKVTCGIDPNKWGITPNLTERKIKFIRVLLGVCVYYLGHRCRCVCSSRRCSGCCRGRCWSRRGHPNHSHHAHGSLGPEPCSHWLHWLMSHPYAHPDEEHRNISIKVTRRKEQSRRKRKTCSYWPVCSQQILSWHGFPPQANLQHEEFAASDLAGHYQSPPTSG